MCHTEHIPWLITVQFMPLFVGVALHGRWYWRAIPTGTDGGLSLGDAVSKAQTIPALTVLIHPKVVNGC